MKKPLTNKTLIIALGSNMGDKMANILLAYDKLTENLLPPEKLSKIYQSAPMYVTSQQTFLNSVILTTTDLLGDDILKILKKIEKQIGRTPTYKNGPRIIDLDILYLGDSLITTHNLSIPHLHISAREFVLRPMLDIDPTWFDVRAGKTILQMFNALNSNGQVCPVGKKES